MGNFQPPRYFKDLAANDNRQSSSYPLHPYIHLHFFSGDKGSDEESIVFEMSKNLIIIKSFEITFLPVVFLCLKQKTN